MDEEAIASRLEDVVWHSEAPLPNVNAAGRVAVAEAAHAKGLKVILTGKLISPRRPPLESKTQTDVNRGRVRRTFFGVFRLHAEFSP